VAVRESGCRNSAGRLASVFARTATGRRRWWSDGNRWRTLPRLRLPRDCATSSRAALQSRRSLRVGPGQSLDACSLDEPASERSDAESAEVHRSSASWPSPLDGRWRALYPRFNGSKPPVGVPELEPIL